MNEKYNDFIKSLKEFHESLNELEEVRNTINIDFLKTSSITFGNLKSGSTIINHFLDQYALFLIKKYYKHELDDYKNKLKDKKYISSLNFHSDNYLYVNFHLRFIRNFFDYIDDQYINKVFDRVTDSIFKMRPWIYTGFRGKHIKYFLKYKSHLKKFNLICLIRDPRDVAISSYYSTQSDKRESKKNKIPDLNSYVLDFGIKSSFNELGLVSTLLQPNLVIYKYEDYWLNKKEFCIDLIQSLNLPLDEEILDRSFEQVFVPLSELNIFGSDKLRDDIPGLHKSILSKDTINLINSNYKPLLELYKYC